MLKYLSKIESIFLLEQINDLNHCNRLDDFTNILISFGKQFDFDCISCTIVNVSGFLSDPKNNSQISLNIPDEFWKNYFKNKHFEIDVPLQAYLKSAKVVSWRDCLHTYGNDKPNMVDKSFYDIGINDGHTYGSFYERENCMSVFSFGKYRLAKSKINSGILSLMVPQFSCCYKQIVTQSSNVVSTLTKREIEVLNWLKEGKTSWEISRILTISERCVNFHVTNIQTKLDATNRTQAVAVALNQNLISL